MSNTLLRLDNRDRLGNEFDRGDVELSVDIVAVHGLNGNSTDTWTDRSNADTETLWLRDLLPKSISIARVLTYGYNADAFSFYGSGSVDRIQQQAETLVAVLQADRSLEGCSQRPITFICHGLGGILVKKALAHSSTQTSKNVVHLHSIFISTFAILFFGTPHNGASKSNWLVPLRGTDTPAHIYQNEILSVVNKDSESLQMITAEFSPLMKQFHIFFFWEEVPTDLGNRTVFVVEESSAAPLMYNTERSGIRANHEGMVRFSSSSCSSYRTVIEALKRYCREAPIVVAGRWRQTNDLLARTRSHEASELVGTGFDVHNDNEPFYYQPKVYEKSRNKHFYPPQPVSSIFTGREDISAVVESSLLAENDSSSPRQQRRFIIYGIGGSGKTQFCCKFAQDHRDKFWAVFSIDATSMATANQSFASIGKIGGLEATAESGKHWLAHIEEPWLLIINNADDPSLNLPDLFPEGERGHILVNTRNPEFRIHETVGYEDFKVLKKNEALLLLLKAAKIPRPWTPADEESGNRVAAALGYLALALIQAGNHILERLCQLRDYLSYYDYFRKENSVRPRSPEEKADEHDHVYSMWDLSLKSIQLRSSQASRDAIQLLNIIAFFHFEHIRVDIFTRALDNRLMALEPLRKRSFPARFFEAFRTRFQPPPVLPDFLRGRPSKDHRWRVSRALRQLNSFSLISYDGKDESFSLHPLVRAWARDRLSKSEQALWAHVAVSTIVESILLPPRDIGEVHQDFRRDILPHLDECLKASPVHILDYKVYFGGYKLPLAICFRYPTLILFRDQVIKAAKCGYVYTERGRFKEGAEYFLIAKDALVASRGYEDANTMMATLALSRTYWGLGRLNEAVALQNLVVEARKKVYGQEHHLTLLAMNELGRSYWLNGQYHEAVKLQTLTTDLMKKTLGEDDADTLASMDNLGVTLGSWHRYRESEKVHRRVLSFREKKLGSTNVETLETINNLAMALLDLKHPIEAHTLMIKVYEERKQQLGKEHPWTLWALCNLAKVRTELGQLQEAEQMLVNGIAAAKRSLGPNHLGVLMGCGELARVLARQRRFDEAEIMTRDTIERLEEFRGPEHPDTVYALWKMAKLYELQSNLEGAVKTCELALERANMRLTRSHPLGEEIYCYFHELTSRLQLRTQRETSIEIPADRKPVGLKDRQNFKFTRAATR